MFRGSDLTKIMGMLGLLAVLGMLMLRARDASVWRWLEREPSAAVQAPAAPASPGTRAADSPAAETVAAGPTDEDPEQQADAKEEAQAVSDGSLGIQPEENLLYGRLFYWVQHQSFEALRRRSRSGVTFADLLHSPDKYRGRLVRIDLDVRRVLVHDEADSSVGVQRVYELWGFSEDSGAWLYDVVTAELPPGMPTGASVDERVQFVGYFFKLQGYLEAGAKPRAAPLRAPLLVGRLVRYPSAAALASGGSNGWVLGVVAAMAAGTLLLALAQVAFHRRAARRRAAALQQTSDVTRQWLNEGFTPGAEPAVPIDGPGAEAHP